MRVWQVPAARRDVVLQALQNNPNIEFAEVNALAASGALTNDPYVTNGAEWHLNEIQAPDAAISRGLPECGRGLRDRFL